MAQEFDVEFIESGDRAARFLVRGLTPALANGFRRAMIADVPTFSIDTVRVALDVEGPDTAYSGDIESADPLVEPADTNVPIIELKEGQRLEFEADAVLDTGKDHAKHQGGVSVGFRHLQRVDVVDDLGEFDEEDAQI